MIQRRVIELAKQLFISCSLSERYTLTTPKECLEQARRFYEVIDEEETKAEERETNS